MLLTKCVVLCISCFVVGSSASSLVPFIDPCTPEDSVCILNSANKALPHFTGGTTNLPGMTPIENLAVGNVDASVGDLNLNFNDMVLSGTSKTNLISIVRNHAENTMKLVLDIPIVLTGKYKMSGKFLTYEMSGDGDCKFDSEAVQFTINVKLEKFDRKDGETCYKIRSFDYVYDLIKKVNMYFGNLSGGDKEKAAVIENMLKENWKELFNTFSGPPIKECVTIIMKIINDFLKAVPANQLEIA